jgi:hypothetical protein
MTPEAKLAKAVALHPNSTLGDLLRLGLLTKADIQKLTGVVIDWKK